MKKKRLKSLLALVVASTLAFSSMPFMKVNAEVQVDRIEGIDRFFTSKEVGLKFKSADTVIIVNGYNFPDALSATPLAKKYNAPILLNGNEGLYDSAGDPIYNLMASKAILIGGKNALGDRVEEDLRGRFPDLEIERISGSNRYETSVEIAKRVGLENGIFATTGEKFADALSAGSIAATKQMPIILTEKDVLDSSTVELLSKNKINKTYLVGGEGVVTHNVEEQLPNVERISGENRYDTNKNVINKFKSEINIDNLFIATGTNYPDALAGTALAAKENNPIVLTAEEPFKETMDIVENAKKFTVLGGENVVTKITQDKLAGINVTDLKVSFIDVGQAESILIQNNGHNMLIDAGNNEDEQVIDNFLKKQGVDKLDCVLATHAHEDHIGAMDFVLNNYKVDHVYRSGNSTTTQTYKDFIEAIKNNNIESSIPSMKDKFYVGSARIDIVYAPYDEKISLNNSSVIAKLTFGKNSYLFTGDTEAEMESDMVTFSDNILESDVLKVAHHGSDTSTAKKFLDKVNPKYAVISCGKDNEYGHPDKTVLDRLKSKSVSIYRTDKSGDIISTSDGKNITFDNEEFKDNNNNSDEEAQAVYVTKSGKAFHKSPECSNMGSPIAMNREDAINKGYKPCSKCNP